MATVFMSYSHKDSDVADQIGDILSEQKVDFFRDRKDIEWGDSINSEVRLGLEEASALLVIVSPASLKSHWVPYEVGYASALGKKILPYLTHPSIDVPDYIRDLKNLTAMDELREYFASHFRQEIQSLALPETSFLPDDASARFRRIKGLMPKLLAEMKEDVETDETQLVREFFVASIKGAVFVKSEKSRFRYNQDEHDNLLNKIDLLEEYGFVISTAPNVYRMTEEFIGLLIDADLTA